MTLKEILFGGGSALFVLLTLLQLQKLLLQLTLLQLMLLQLTLLQLKLSN